jgi:hypothetical protein
LDIAGHARLGVCMNRSSLFSSVRACGDRAGGGCAHGTADSARDTCVAEFLHAARLEPLLFTAAAVLLAGDLRRAAKLISLFVAGHSLTLLVATMAGWQISATLVDVVIALGVGIRRRDGPARATARLATHRSDRVRLRADPRAGSLHAPAAPGLPEDGLLWRVIAFNVAVEIGQLLAPPTRRSVKSRDVV